ncbi:Uncharacterized protein DAT39_023099, partial [Clarias magur]
FLNSWILCSAGCSRVLRGAAWDLDRRAVGDAVLQEVFSLVDWTDQTGHHGGEREHLPLSLSMEDGCSWHLKEQTSTTRYTGP